MSPPVLQYEVSCSDVVFENVFFFPDWGNGSEKSTVRWLHLSSSPAEELQLTRELRGQITSRTNMHEFTMLCFPHLIHLSKVTKVNCSRIVVRMDIWGQFFLCCQMQDGSIYPWAETECIATLSEIICFVNLIHTYTSILSKDQPLRTRMLHCSTFQLMADV